MLQEVLEHFGIHYGETYYTTIKSFFGERTDDGSMDEYFIGKKVPYNLAYISFKIEEGPDWFEENMVTLVKFKDIKLLDDWLGEIKYKISKENLVRLVNELSNLFYYDLSSEPDDLLADILIDSGAINILPSNKMDDWRLKSEEGIEWIKKLKKPGK